MMFGIHTGSVHSKYACQTQVQGYSTIMVMAYFSSKHLTLNGAVWRLPDIQQQSYMIIVTDQKSQ